MNRKKHASLPVTRIFAYENCVDFLAHFWLSHALKLNLSRIYLTAAFIYVCLSVLRFDAINVELFVGLSVAFTLLGCAAEGKKTEGIKAAFWWSFRVAEIATVQFGQAIVAVIAKIPVFVPRPERRTSPPEKITSPTLYPRLVATPWHCGA